MGFRLESIVPWGRSYTEYRAMFGLEHEELQTRIVGVGDGPASFNAELSADGGQVVSVDPIYQFGRGEIAARIEAVYPQMMEQIYDNRSYLCLDRFGSAEHLGQARLNSMQRFLNDYDTGRQQGRYQVGALPALPFADKQFDLALCSHLLFLYSEQIDLEFHLNAIEELCRIANTVKIFPLLDLTHQTSSHLLPVIRFLEQLGYTGIIKNVDYEFQIGANQMLLIQPSREIL